MSSIKILFVDIDGVCNASWAVNKPEYMRNGHLFVIPEKSGMIKEIQNRMDAKLVLSSTWRKGYFDLQNEIKSRDIDDYLALRDVFAEYGMVFFGHTPITNGGMCRRGEEIDLWIKNWDSEPIESICIIDDLNGRYLRPYAGRLVRTSFDTGILRKHVELAVQILGKSKDMENSLEEEVWYWRTKDGMPVLCNRTEATLTEEEHCYVCARSISTGETAMLLFAVEEDSEFVLCPECAEKACEKA